MSSDHIDDIEELARMVAGSGASEVTVRWSGGKVRIRKPAQPARSEWAVPAAPAPLVSATAPQAALPEQDAFHWITAPLVGIFRHAEPPAARGVRIQAGQSVGSIESMRVFTDVPAEFSGIVREVAVEGGMAVEYGQQLLAIAVEEP